MSLPADVVELVHGGAGAALALRSEAVEGGETVRIDGLLLALTNLPDPAQNSVWVERGPADAERALADAERAFRDRGMPWFGIELHPGRDPKVDLAIRGAGLTRLFVRPTMAALIADVPMVAPPTGVTIERVHDDAGLAAMRAVEVAAFETAPEVAEGLAGPGSLERDELAFFAAWDERGEPVGESIAYLAAGTIGVFGVGVVEGARGHGIGAAMTSAATHAFDAGIAWLQPSDRAIPLYRRLGFRTICDWEVWSRGG